MQLEMIQHHFPGLLDCSPLPQPLRDSQVRSTSLEQPRRFRGHKQSPESAPDLAGSDRRLPIAAPPLGILAPQHGNPGGRNVLPAPGG